VQQHRRGSNASILTSEGRVDDELDGRDVTAGPSGACRPPPASGTRLLVGRGDIEHLNLPGFAGCERRRGRDGLGDMCGRYGRSACHESVDTAQPSPTVAPAE
jgi:hypothetical protein